MKQRISIFGCGWLGLPLAQTLIAAGYPVKGSTTTPARTAELTAAGIIPCVTSLQGPDEALAELLDCDTLIIAITSKDVEGFAQLVQHLNRAPVQQVLFISSTSVYPFNNQTIAEHDGVELTEHPLYQIEQRLQAGTDFTTTVIRMAGLIDERRHPGRFFQHKPIPNPDACVNLIHRDDCIGLIQAIITQQAWGEVFNGCADTHPSKREFYRFAANQLGLPAPTEKPVATPRFKQINNDYAKTRLGYQFQHPDLLKIVF